MEQREKLIELLDGLSIDTHDDVISVANWLITNGVVVLPCRCGDCEHCEIGQNDVEQWCICTSHYGKEVDVDPTDFCPRGKRKGGDE